MRSAQSSLILFCSAISLCLDAPRAEAQNPREFKQDVAMSGDKLVFHFSSPQALNLRAPTTRVDLYYRVNRSALQAVEMQAATPAREFETALQGLGSGDEIDYYYSQVLTGRYAEIPVDS